MINILVADDNPHKIANIRKLLDSIPEIKEYEVKVDLVNVKKELTSKHYDLIILDLNIPMRMGDEAKPENGANFLEELKGTDRYILPGHIIGLSAFEQAIEKYKITFEDDLWALIKYEENSEGWSDRIKRKIEYLIQSKRDFQNSQSLNYQYDLAIVTALRVTELDSILDLPANWEAFKVPNDSTEYHKGIFERDGKRISVVAGSALQMGMVATSVVASKMIVNFRPKFMSMTGIAGGIKGNGNFGDILAADISFDSGSGKIKSNTAGDAYFVPDYKSINLQTDIKELLQECKGTRFQLDQIKEHWKAPKPDTQLNLHIGPLASGAGVVENKKVIEEIKDHSRKLVGIDMETYGLFYAAINCAKPRPIAVMSFKSISDFADPEKNDDFQTYAAFTSANFLYEFSLQKLPL